MHIHDLVGIGFGPSNIALAIAMEEKAPDFDMFFVERQPGFSWHRNMLLRDTHLQISFLKDLATLRNPRSDFTFINYLHEKGRLQDFINLKTFTPSRVEFNDYLAWAAGKLDHLCAYGEAVFDVVPEFQGGEVRFLRVRSRDGSGRITERRARNLVVGVGGEPAIPEHFAALRDDPRVFHSNGYLADIVRNADARRIAIIGAGQSAAEIFIDLDGRPGAPSVDLIMRARSIKPSDDSPFVNEIFNADFTGHVFSRSAEERAQVMEEFRHTNYAAPDLAYIERIFNIFYQQRVEGASRHRFLRRHEVTGVSADAEGVHLTMTDLNTGATSTRGYDAVVLATGYQRRQHLSVLETLSAHIDAGAVDRQYRVATGPGFHPTIFIQGACEATHGLSDTLLSVVAIRTGEIGDALLAATRANTAENLGVHAVAAQ